MDKNDILDYVMNTPSNTNRAVLSSMLNNISGGSVSESNAFIINDIITNSDELMYHTLDKTYEEIEMAFLSGKACIIHFASSSWKQTYSYDLVLSVQKVDIDEFWVNSSHSYVASATDQYPFYTMEP